MDNPLVKVIDSELDKVGITDARLVHDSYAPQDFGNAEAVYDLSNLRLRFVRDRSIDTAEIGSCVSENQFYILEDVAVWMGWLSLDELLKYDSPINFDEPPLGPILSLPEALGLIKKDFSKLDKAFAAGTLMVTNTELKQIERQRMKSKF